MQARAPLMIEHRLIERMLALINKEAMRIRETKKIDPVFIDNAVDFIRVYADKTHHGKEEDILFRDLAGKEMNSEERRIMNELVEEHKLGRKAVSDLVDAKKRHFAGDKSALEIVLEKLGFFVTFYPRHIEKEDKVFFPAMMTYLPQEEQESLLARFWEFDRNIIHQKYRNLVEELAS
ncbi:MAG: hemerythrin domain-containing protein [Desulfomonilaceae bacterium]